MKVLISSGLTLRIRYYGPTAAGLGSRFVVSDDRGRRVSLPFDYGASDGGRCRVAVETWVEHYLPECFAGSFVVGSVSSREWCAVFLPVGVTA